MFRRPFFTFLGLGTGVALGAWGVLQVERVRRRLRPDNLKAAAGARAGSLSQRISAAIEEGRAAAEAKEAELRGVYRVGEAPQVVPPRKPVPRPLRPPPTP